MADKVLDILVVLLGRNWGTGLLIRALMANLLSSNIDGQDVLSLAIHKVLSDSIFITFDKATIEDKTEVF